MDISKSHISHMLSRLHVVFLKREKPPWAFCNTVSQSVSLPADSKLKLQTLPVLDQAALVAMVTQSGSKILSSTRSQVMQTESRLCCPLLHRGRVI